MQAGPHNLCNDGEGRRPRREASIHASMRATARAIRRLGVRGRLGAETGVALPVAMAVLLLVSILVAAIAATAMQSNDNANRDRDSKRALSAAEAGLQTAVYRLNNVKPPADKCLTNVAVDPVAGECPGRTESIGNGAEFTYYVTPIMGLGAVCGSIPGQIGTSERCITAVGLADGVRRRIQTRVSTDALFQPFLEAGVIGLDLVQINNSGQFKTSVGSNVQITLGNSVNVDGAAYIAPGGNVTIGGSSSVSGGTQTHVPFVLPPADFAGPAASNNNASLNSSYYNAATRTFTMATSAEYTMPAGTYSFCNLSLGNSVRLRLPATGLVKIFIDSAARPGSGCGAGTGRLLAKNSVEFNKNAGKAENLEIYVYGTRNEPANADYDCPPAGTTNYKHDIIFCNSVQFYGSIYAADSTFFAANSVEMWGAVAAKRALFDNSVKFELPTAVKNKGFNVAGGAATTKGWFECREQPTTPSDPESGC